MKRQQDGDQKGDDAGPALKKHKDLQEENREERRKRPSHVSISVVYKPDEFARTARVFAVSAERKIGSADFPGLSIATMNCVNIEKYSEGLLSVIGELTGLYFDLGLIVTSYLPLGISALFASSIAVSNAERRFTLELGPVLEALLTVNDAFLQCCGVRFPHVVSTIPSHLLGMDQLKSFHERFRQSLPTTPKLSSDAYWAVRNMYCEMKDSELEPHLATVRLDCVDLDVFTKC